MGRPKALLRLPDGMSSLEAACRVLRAGGCDAIEVVVGAQADDAIDLLDATDLHRVHVSVNREWGEGMGASLRMGLDSLANRSDASSVIVHLVDLPDVGADVVRRLARESGTGPDALARAAYGGEAGHPVLLGRDHWAGIAASAQGDRGARDYLRTHPPRLVEVGDLATGRDVDTVADLDLLKKYEGVSPNGPDGPVTGSLGG